MDTVTTRTWLNSVFETMRLSMEPQKLLVWDTFRVHCCDEIEKYLQKLNVKQLVIPSGCTGLIQAPDVSWNRPFKQKLQDLYDKWLAHGEHTFTPAGKMRAPTKRLIAE